MRIGHLANPLPPSVPYGRRGGMCRWSAAARRSTMGETRRGIGMTQADQRDNEAGVRRLIDEVINQGQTGPLAELVGADHVGHDTLGDHYGPDGVRISVAELRTAFPDLRISIDDLLAAGDRVVHRFTK